MSARKHMLSTLTSFAALLLSPPGTLHAARADAAESGRQ